MSSSERLPLWWDHDINQQTGARLRTDVREAAHKVWKWVLRKSDEILGDPSEAAEIMERAVKTVSQYLDKRNIPLGSMDPSALLIVASHRLLRRIAKKRSRIELVGATSELAELLRAPDWRDETDRKVFLEELARELSPSARGILRLRIGGYDWNEIAQMMHMKSSNLRASFWREVRRAHFNLLRSGRGRPDER
jgi:DNA-directed RNA polymerase specialized sigma24 family protein